MHFVLSLFTLGCVRQCVGSPPVDVYIDLLRLVEPPLLDEVMHRVVGNR